MPTAIRSTRERLAPESSQHTVTTIKSPSTEPKKRFVHGRSGANDSQCRHVGVEHDQRFRIPQCGGRVVLEQRQQHHDKTLCTSTDVKFGKAAPAAKLTSTNMLVLAAGNLFTGTFAYKSLTGTVQFGQPYDFTVRPSALKVKYHAKVGTVDKVRTSGDICPYIKKGDPDMARIFVAIVDWNAPHQVVSAMTTTKGAWDPEKGIDNVSEGKILGYGSLWITQSTEGDDMQDAELEIVWYDHETRPSGGGTHS